MFDRQFARTQQALGERHAPGQQIFHRRQADEAAEPREEGRSRHCGFGGEIGDGPAMRRARVYGPQGGDQTTVRKPARNARHRRAIGSATQGLDEQHFDIGGGEGAAGG